MGVYNPKLNCSTAAKHPTTFPDLGEIFVIFCQFRVKNHEKHLIFCEKEETKINQNRAFLYENWLFFTPKWMFLTPK